MSRARARRVALAALTVEAGDLLVLVGEDGELDLGLADLVDLLDPLLVLLGAVHRHHGHLDLALGELLGQLSNAADLGRAHGREVTGVAHCKGEAQQLSQVSLRCRTELTQNGPRALDVLVPRNGAILGVGSEVRGQIADADVAPAIVRQAGVR